MKNSSDRQSMQHVEAGCESQWLYSVLFFLFFHLCFGRVLWFRFLLHFSRVVLQSDPCTHCTCFQLNETAEHLPILQKKGEISFLIIYHTNFLEVPRDQAT